MLFGPHVTNLGDDDRALTDRHLAYYRRRALGGCGTIVIEEASVHESDWPYERAPLAERCGDGWARIATALRSDGALAIAALGHAGGQGSSAYSQRPLLAPSRVPEVNSREVPKWMEPEDIAAVVAGFGAAAAAAAAAGLDGVEVNAGQHSLIRQFLSGLTNQRGDDWGVDRLRFARDVLAADRGAIGPERVLGLRLSGDELAPWAGITPDQAPAIAAELAAAVDYLVVVRGAIYSAEKTRPDFHEPPGFNVELCRAVRQVIPDGVAVVLQGSVVDVGQAGWALEDGVADVVEMTRAQIADPDLVAKLRASEPDRIRPCIRCNQTCQVRDARNPIVTCVGEPTSGRETEDPDWYAPAPRPGRCSSWGPDRRGWRRPAWLPSGAIGSGWSRRPSSSAAWPRSPERVARSCGGWLRSWIGWPSPWSGGRRRGRRAPGRSSCSAAAAGGASRPTRWLTVGRCWTWPRSAPARSSCRARDGSSCSTRSVAPSPSPWPRSSATGPSSSRRTTSPATSSRARGIWRRPTSACSSAASTSNDERSCGWCAPRRRTARRPRTPRWRSRWRIASAASAG